MVLFKLHGAEFLVDPAFWDDLVFVEALSHEEEGEEEEGGGREEGIFLAALEVPRENRRGRKKNQERGTCRSRKPVGSRTSRRCSVRSVLFCLFVCLFLA